MDNTIIKIFTGFGIICFLFIISKAIKIIFILLNDLPDKIILKIILLLLSLIFISLSCYFFSL